MAAPAEEPSDPARPRSRASDAATELEGDPRNTSDSNMRMIGA